MCPLFFLLPPCPRIFSKLQIATGMCLKGGTLPTGDLLLSHLQRIGRTVKEIHMGCRSLDRAHFPLEPTELMFPGNESPACVLRKKSQPARVRYEIASCR